MTREDDANDMIARFGGQSALARALGVNQSTVQHWSKTGHVPSWRREQIERAAAQHGIALGASGRPDGPARGLGTGSGLSGVRGGAVTIGRVLTESGARRLGAGTVGRPMMGYGRASASPGHAPAPVPAPFVHGRADTIVHPDKEIGALREEIVQLRSLVEQLVGAVDELRSASKPKRAAAKRTGAPSEAPPRTRTAGRQRPSVSKRARS